jgi:hypothetical protein
MHIKFWLGNLKGRDFLDNIRLGLWEIGWEVVDGIHLAQDRDQWWGVVDMVMNNCVL